MLKRYNIYKLNEQFKVQYLHSLLTLEHTSGSEVIMSIIELFIVPLHYRRNLSIEPKHFPIVALGTLAIDFITYQMFPSHYLTNYYLFDMIIYYL